MLLGGRRTGVAAALRFLLVLGALWALALGRAQTAGRLAPRARGRRDPLEVFPELSAAVRSAAEGLPKGRGSALTSAAQRYAAAVVRASAARPGGASLDAVAVRRSALANDVQSLYLLPDASRSERRRAQLDAATAALLECFRTDARLVAPEGGDRFRRYSSVSPGFPSASRPDSDPLYDVMLP